MSEDFNTDFKFALIDKDKNILYLKQYELERLEINVNNIKKHRTLGELNRDINDFIKGQGKNEKKSSI